MRIIDLRNCDEIIESIKYLPDNKAAGLDSIVAELLKSGGLSLVKALIEMIQQVWIEETLPESWTEGLLCPVYKKFDWKNYRIICLLNVAYKVLAKVLHSRLLPYANAVVQQFNITTHHLFIDFKATYETIARNEIYVIVVELDN
jgi:hypothetical protein